MQTRRFLQLDVFAERPGDGNALAVVVDAEGLSDAEMQAFARWTKLSETVFLLPPGDGADYRVRIFTPRQELPFAGHPSVGAAWAAVDSGLATPKDGTLVQDCAAGLLPAHVDPDMRVAVRAPRAHPLPDAPGDADRLDKALSGLARGQLSPACWDNGPRWWLAELASEDDVRRMQPDLPAIAELTGTAAVGLAVFALSDVSAGYDMVVRAFCPLDGIPEDPVTGSANACVGAALAEAGRLPGRAGSYLASQGREVGRDGRVEVRIDAEGAAWVGGAVQCVIRGTVAW